MRTRKTIDRDRFSAEIRLDVLQELRHRAVDERRPLAQIVEEAIAEYLARHPLEEAQSA